MGTADQRYRYCHECRGEFWPTTTACPDCGALTVSYPPVEDAAEAGSGASPGGEEVVEFDLSSLTATERRSLEPWLVRAGIAHAWRDGVWLQVGGHRAGDAAEIIEHLPPADDPADPAARRTEVLEKLLGVDGDGTPAPIGRLSMASFVTMMLGWVRSKLHGRR